MLFMIRKWISLLCILFILGIIVLPAFGQAPVPPQPNPGGTAAQPQAGKPQGKTAPVEHGAPAAEYFIALIGTLGILVIVCMPSRKR